MAGLVIAEHEPDARKGVTLNTITSTVQCNGEGCVLMAGVAKALLANVPQLAEQFTNNAVAQVLVITKKPRWARRGSMGQ